MPIRIVLADDHVMVRQGLRVLLEQAGMVVLGEAADGLETLWLQTWPKPTLLVNSPRDERYAGLFTANTSDIFERKGVTTKATNWLNVVVESHSHLNR